MFDIVPYQQKLDQLCQRHHVEELSIFGSALREDFSAESDLDFAVVFAPLEPASYATSYFEFIEVLENLFGRSVDLISLQAVENPYLRSSIEASKEMLYTASKKHFVYRKQAAVLHSS